MAERHVHLDLPARLESLPGVHGALAQVGPDLEPDARADLALLAVELVTNAVRHSGAGPGELVALDLSVAPGTARVEVRDPGGGFDPGGGTPTDRQLGGRGLFLVEQLADRWGLVREGPCFLAWAELWTDGRTRHRRVPPRMLPLGSEAVAPDEEPIPSASEVRALSDAGLKDELNLLAEEERAVSGRRRHLHRHIDALRLELERRLEVPRADAVLSAADLAELARMLSLRMPSPSPSGPPPGD